MAGSDCWKRDCRYIDVTPNELPAREARRGKNAFRLPQKGEIPKDSLCKTHFSRRPKGAGENLAFRHPQKGGILG